MDRKRNSADTKKIVKRSTSLPAEKESFMATPNKKKESSSSLKRLNTTERESFMSPNKKNSSNSLKRSNTIERGKVPEYMIRADVSDVMPQKITEQSKGKSIAKIS